MDFWFLGLILEKAVHSFFWGIVYTKILLQIVFFPFYNLFSQLLVTLDSFTDHLEYFLNNY